MKKKLLINFVYYRPVGHLVEGLKFARGYCVRNKNIEIYLLFNADSPVEIARSCKWIKKVYPVSLREVCKYGKNAPSLRGIPRTWDYIVSDFRAQSFKKGWDENDLAQTQAVLQNLFEARVAKGFTQAQDAKPILPYERNAHLDISIPQTAKKYARRFKHKGPTICILPGGSAGARQSPSLKLWLEICQSLEKSIPNLKIYFTGVTKSKEGRTATNDFSSKDIDVLVGKLKNAENCLNIGLWNQLALIKRCNIFLSPHTGFAFLVPCVGTPWLALSGCPWSEYFFNDIPFYSVLPDCGWYPSAGEIKKGCGKVLWSGKKSICMKDAALRKKIPEIVRGAILLLDPKFKYPKAVKIHLKNLKKKHIKNAYFLDGVEGLMRK